MFGCKEAQGLASRTECFLQLRFENKSIDQFSDQSIRALKVEAVDEKRFVAAEFAKFIAVAESAEWTADKLVRKQKRAFVFRDAGRQFKSHSEKTS